MTQFSFSTLEYMWI